MVNVVNPVSWMIPKTCWCGWSTFGELRSTAIPNLRVQSDLFLDVVALGLNSHVRRVSGILDEAPKSHLPCWARPVRGGKAWEFLPSDRRWPSTSLVRASAKTDIFSKMDIQIFMFLKSSGSPVCNNHKQELCGSFHLRKRYLRFSFHLAKTKGQN